MERTTWTSSNRRRLARVGEGGRPGIFRVDRQRLARKTRTATASVEELEPLWFTTRGEAVAAAEAWAGVGAATGRGHCGGRGRR
jgi:hypothetical protein